ncbi:MAG: hypothetical protein QM763_13285 [Agriterribacter sp.]
MKAGTLFLIFILLTVGTSNGQTSISKPEYLKYEIGSLLKDKIFISLDTLFSQIEREQIDKGLIKNDDLELSLSMLSYLSGFEKNTNDSTSDVCRKELLNLYPISANEYWISIAFIRQKNNAAPTIEAIINLIATASDNNILFSIPLKYLTKEWKTKKVGNMTYFYRNKINITRAKGFDKKNKIIADKLGLQPQKFNFYLCSNYQEILFLLGWAYYAELNGKTKDGFLGGDYKTIFSIMNNEDFSHDIFHFYANKTRSNSKMNHTAEEGIAYSWGNAYYAKANGEMIQQKELIEELKNYITANPNSSLLELFQKDIKIFNSLPSEISVKSTISSLLCDEVEAKKGIEGIKTLIKCGAGDDNFFRVLNDLVSINPTNFEKEVRKLIYRNK